MNFRVSGFRELINNEKIKPVAHTEHHHDIRLSFYMVVRNAQLLCVLRLWANYPGCATHPRNATQLHWWDRCKRGEALVALQKELGADTAFRDSLVV